MTDICPKNIECNTYFISIGSENGLIESHVRENSFFSSIIIFGPRFGPLSAIVK